MVLFSEKISTTPFKAQLLASTTAKYAETWAEILSLILLGLEETDEERRFKLTPPQKTAFTKLKSLLTKTTPVEPAKMSAAVVDATYALTACRLGGEEDGEDHPIVAYTILKN